MTRTRARRAPALAALAAVLALAGAAASAQLAPQADTTTPSITAPPDVILDATGPPQDLAAEVASMMGRPAVSDNSDPSPAVSSDAPGQFPVGTTIVTWTATDASGNSASALQRIVVSDRVSPSITPPPDLALDAAAPTTVLTEALAGEASASDNLDASPAVTSNATARLGIGESRIAWTATDSAGNTATAYQTVTVSGANASEIEPNTGLINDTFDGSVSPWRAWGAPLEPHHPSVCTPTATNRHALLHSGEHGGSAHFDLNGACGYHYVGMQRDYSFGSGHGGDDLEIAFDYRSAAKDGKDARAVYLLTVSGHNGAHPFNLWEVVTPGQASSDTGWQTHTATARSMDPSLCPCRILFFMLGDSSLETAAYIDNVRAAAVPVDHRGAAGSAAAGPGSHGLTRDEIFAMLEYDADGHNILVTSRQAGADSIRIEWDTTVHAGPYRVELRPAADPSDITAAATNGSSHTFSGLAPGTGYAVSVEAADDASTRTELAAATAGGPAQGIGAGPAAPQAPQNLRAELGYEPGAGLSISLSWDHAPSYDGYAVEVYDEASGSWSAAASVQESGYDHPLGRDQDTLFRVYTQLDGARSEPAEAAYVTQWAAGG